MKKVEIFENERAAAYDKFVKIWIPNYHYFLDHLPKLLDKKGKKELLVVGCGTGNEIERFIGTSEPENWAITGIDPSPEMIKQANDKFQKFDNVNIINGLVSDLDIEKKYNVATLLLVLHFLDDNGSKLNLLKDIADRLISGAVFVLLDITGGKDQIKQNLQILKLLLPDGLDEEQINYRQNRIENELYAVSEERLSELLQDAGFEKPLRFFQSSIYMGWLTKKK
ncbi:MAG TPA: class I SAM-dependent methyltransferase [Candidatus Kapabacteria bacterium]|nr:class I SAM-dependent methyltransferase [Candidatus Kapabacteria bacterium]